MIFKKTIIKKNFLAFLTLSFSFIAHAQLTISTSMTPAQLVQNVLLGSGVTASNITYNGAPLAIGSFNGSVSNIGLPAGVIMSCGDISNAVGPNNTSSASTGNSLLGDPDLDIVFSPTESYDATILEFDFIPISDTIKFKYVFGSEEYMEYVSSFPGGINDGFGFFISGPGITGPFSNNAKNIAIIPGTTLPVTMFNLNLNSNSTFYFDNGDGFGSGTAPDGATVQYDGFTVPLIAISEVQCGQTYHIKIAIADGGDDILDSGVFLEAGSFSSQGVNIISEISYGGANDSTLYEGCGAACIHFVRAANLSNPDTINLTIAGSAINGTDYYDNNTGPGTPLPTQLVFAVGQDSISFCLNASADGSAEGLESINLSIAPIGSGLCIQPGSSATIYLSEYTPLILTTSNDTTLCNMLAPVTLIANVTGGVQPYTYSWTNGAGPTANPTVNPTTNTTYIVTVNDACTGSPSDPTPQVTDSIAISLITIPAVTSTVSYGGTNDSTFYEGCGQACIYFIRTLDIAKSANYTLNLGGTATNGIDYSPALPTLLVFAAGQDSLSYCINAVADGAGEAIESVQVSINVTGACSLTSSTTLYIAGVAPLTLLTSNDTSLCNVLAPVTLIANVTGGVQPYTYSWTNGAGPTANPTVNPTTNTTYIVTVNDACVGSPSDPTPPVTDSVTVSLVTIPVITSTINYGGTNDSTFYEGCGQACIYFVRTLNIAQPANYTLSFGGTATNGVDYSPALPAMLVFAAGQDSLSYCINAVADGAVEAIEAVLVSIDITGACNLNSSTTLYIAEAAPLTLLTSNDTILNCITGPVNLSVNVSGGVPPYSYLWSNISGSIATQIVVPSANSVYTIIVSDACSGSPDPTPDKSDSIQVTLNIPVPLTVNAGFNQTACPDDVVNLSVVTSGGAQPLIYSWTSTGSDTVSSSGAQSTTVTTTATAIYTITVTDNCGNTASDDVSVYVEQSCLLSIPNVITPDGKGSAINETFFIENLNRFPLSSLVIYSRWGDKIFEASNYQNNWNGNKYPDGTYYYVLTVPPSGQILAKVKPSGFQLSYNEALTGTNKVFTGFFQIVRSK